ncbi:MAG: carotenoid biosynthesis protein [Actinomycetota bacterium]|nr:carotenoid biosynthesis protein [Actinomycetota bacterium]
MGGLDPRLSKAVTTHALVVTGLNVAHSLRVRGVRRTLLFAVLGTAIPVLGENLAVNVLKVLRHHVRPQVGGVPLAIALGWYNVGYGTFAVTESILSATGPHEDEWSRALAPAAALAATNLDLLLDPAGLDLGLWQWSGNGAYAAEVKGPNGKRGVPLLNYAGWIALTTSVALSYRRLALDADATAPSRPRAGGPESGRGAALLLLSYYLPAVAWALKRRRRKYLLYSAPFTATLWAALKGRPQRPPLRVTSGSAMRGASLS